MSNPVNTVDVSQSFNDFLIAHADLLQQKVDKLGGTVPPAGTIRNAGAVWGNFFDDFIQSYMQANGRIEKVTGNTTDATGNVVIGNAIAVVPDGSQVYIDTKIWGRTGPNDFAYARYITRVERDGGSFQSIVDLAAVLTYSVGGTLNPLAGQPDHFVNGNAVEIRVAGKAATNIAWEAQTSVTVAHG